MQYPMVWFFVLGLGLGSCKTEGDSGAKSLPFLGEMTWTTDANGKVDSSVQALPDWRFINQDGDTVASKDMDGKVRVSDFFFTTCPTICPRMSGQMLRIQETFKEDERLMLFSFSIDSKHDTSEVLQAYAEKLGADTRQWQFLTGDPSLMFELAAAHGSFAEADANAPGGFAHSGALILSDRQNRVRGLYDGTNPKEVDRLMVDLEKLLTEPLDFGPRALPLETGGRYE
jgi:protein SCO1/2